MYRIKDEFSIQELPKGDGVIQNVITKNTFYFDEISFEIIKSRGRDNFEISDIESDFENKELQAFLNSLVEEGIYEWITQDGNIK